MRYIIQLLPESQIREHLDSIRAGLVQTVGQNKAQNYPTSHITLVWNLEDTSTLKRVDPKDLSKHLKDSKGDYSINLRWLILQESTRFITLEIAEDTPFVELRQQIFTGIKSYIETLKLVDVSQNMKEEMWPHITLAQNINPQNYEAGMQYLIQELKLPVSIHFDTIALLAQENGGVYKIIESIPF